jgi:hypothetical protein
MITSAKILGVLLLLGLVILFSLNISSVFQEGNPIPVAYGIIGLTITGNGYAKVDEHKYIVRANEKDAKKLKDYLAQRHMVYADQMGAGIFFKGQHGENYSATIRMYSVYFEIWDFSNQINHGFALP